MMSEIVTDRVAKKAFAFSRTTGEFLKPVYADPDQLDLDNWLLPKFATYVEPPELSANQAAIFADERWNIVTDYRGTIYYDKDGTKHTIFELGEEVPEGALLEEPVIPPTVEQQTIKASAECYSRIVAHWDESAQRNILLGSGDYTDDDKTKCVEWINACLSAKNALLAKSDDELIEADVADDQYWPPYPE